MQMISMDEFTRYSFLSGPEFSPDGEHICFVRHQANTEENGYESTLWLYRTRDGHCLQLTSHNQEKGFAWLNDQEILFSGLRKEKDKERQREGEELTVFHKINIHGGEAREAFRVPLTVKGIKPLKDNFFLLFSTVNPNRPDLHGLTEEDKAKELKRRKEEQDYQVLEEIPYWSNGQGFISMNRDQIWMYDAAGGTFTPLTQGNLQIDTLELNQDLTQAVIIAQSFTGKQEVYNCLYMLDLADRRVYPLTAQEKFSWASAHFVGGTLLCRGSAMDRYGLNENNRFWRFDLETGERQLLTPDFETSTWNSVNSDCRYGGGPSVRVDGEYLYFITTQGHSSFINRIDLQGNIQRITRQEGSVDSYAVKDGQVVMVALREQKLQELYRLNPQGGEEQLTNFNSWVQEQHFVVQPQPVSVETAPGVTIDGWVLKPANWQEGKTYPAILNIHGGPKTVYGTVFVHEMQYWANEGFFVFFCNPRGSDGKGNAFADIRGKYGTIDYEDIMAFTDTVLAQYPEIDQSRVGVTGGSYGGFMTNWIIGHTHRFKAAAAQRSISNWVSMGYTTDIGYYFEEDQMGANPWTDSDKVWFHSPLKYADQVKTPTLFIHSDEDYRCWLPEALQMFTALKYHGVEARLCMFRGENHELSRSGKPTHRIRRLKELTQWFERHLKS